MRILLVRHAHAGIRGTWPGDDLERELSERGQAQADAIAKLWGDTDVAVIHSSRAVRCMDTVRPLADRLGLQVHEREQLLEGATPAEALAWLEGLEPTGGAAVACSHGDVIGGIVKRLDARGTDLGGPQRGAGRDGGLQWPKGSTWELEVTDGLVVRGRLHPPPVEA